MSFQGTSTLVADLSGSRSHAAADAGNYYVAVNPTPGTGIISGTPTSFTETSPLLVVANTGNATIYPVYLRLKDITAGAGAATRNFTHVLDTGNRYSSGGTALTISNVNMNSLNKSGASINFGAVTATAASSVRRLLGNNWSRPALIDIVGDCYEFSYGTPVQAIPPSEVTATGIVVTKAVPPVVIGPGQSYAMYVWAGTFGTGITFEVEFGYIEK